MEKSVQFRQNRCEIQNSQLQKKYASLLAVTKTKFPAWNNSDAQHIVTLFPLTHKVDCLYTPSRKKRVLITSPGGCTACCT